MKSNTTHKVNVIRCENKNGEIRVKVNTKEDTENPVLCVNARNDESYSFKVLPERQQKRTLIFIIPVAKLSPLNLYYDVFLEYKNLKGECKSEKVSNKSRIQRLFVNILHSRQQRVTYSGSNYIVTGYFSVGGILSFQVRETDQYDSLKYYLKEILACIIVPFVYWYYKDSKLTYEKFSNYARDNSFYYFSYVQENIKNNKLYFVIKKESPDLDNLLPYKKHVVYFMSIKHLVLALVAKYLIASEAKGHLYTWRHNQSIIKFMLNRKPFVFLQHGVLGLKQVDKTFFANNKMNHADLFITSSEIEKKIVMKFLGYRSENVSVTGLARWDNQKVEKTEKKIFVMPTWRVQIELLSDEEFLASDFYQAYSKLLHSTKIKKVLYDNDYTLHFMMHPKFVRFEKYFRSNDQRIKMMHQSDISIDKELKSSELVITDYSSIMWDSLYYGHPVLLFQFDQAEYLRLQGSYFDFNKDFRNLIVKRSDTLLNKLDKFISGEEQVELQEYRDKYFAYIDKNNSQRINEAVNTWEKKYQFKSLFSKLF